MREHFLQLLQAVQGDVVRMANQVEQALVGSRQALQGWNTDAGMGLMAGDEAIDRQQDRIDEEVLRLIGTQAPVATDLRVLLAVTAIASELERIGDYANGIGKSVLRAVKTPRLLEVPSTIFQMLEIDRVMLRTCIDAFVTLDVAAAESLQAHEENIDALTKQLQRELMATMHADDANIECAWELLRVVQNLERVADRATNIAEKVIFIATSRTPELNP